ncbi:molybdopterin-dependent oxidoreductase [Rubrobacter calidifluminis]|uniref:molybdopterin-dependent oxidoreductase n=1 Tax=Rubrobacter calidifluminis TaxID=1392640 RepID=UPI00235E8A8B|nr:molybdopterin-dependent oxidoreductase [Rubrobacter calidifluminis]
MNLSGNASKSALAGAASGVLALGVTELAHGLSPAVPSFVVSVAQQVARLTPGRVVTGAIETLGTADVAFLIGATVLLTLAVCALLAHLSRSNPPVSLAGVLLLGAVGVLSASSEPGSSFLAVALTAAVALAAGSAAALLILRSPRRDPGALTAARELPVGRSRQTGEREVSVGRRGFLAASGLVVVAGLALAGAGRLLGGSSSLRTPRPRRLKLPAGNPKKGAGDVLHETLPPPPKAASIEVKGMPELITPPRDFYLIDTELSSPRLDADTWKLSVKGAVDNPFEISYKELLEMPTIEADITLCCVSNPVGGGLVSNGRWTGVLLSDILKEAGMSRDEITRASEQLVGRSVDGFTTGFRTALALDGRRALVAFGLDGDQLPVKHGYPVRLVVPGLYGYVSATKWLTEIELTGWSYDAYWVRRTWSKQGPIKTQSRIDTVKDGQTLEAGKVPIGGVAWAPHRGISKVEVSTDGGRSWHAAKLARSLSPDAWRQYVYYWNATPGSHTLQVRATDGTGKTQTPRQSPPHPSGATGYHTIRVSVS